MAFYLEKRGLLIVALVFGVGVFASLLFFAWPKGQETVSIEPEAAIPAFVKQSLAKQYVPSAFDVKHKLILAGTTDGMDTVHGALWESDGEVFYAGFYKNNRTAGLSELKVMIKSKGVATDSGNAASLLQRYFRRAPGTVACKTLEGGVLNCEAFWADKKGNKQGVGVISFSEGSLLYKCFIPVGSEDYERTSCTSL